MQGARVGTLPGLVPDILDVTSAVAELPYEITPLRVRTDVDGKSYLPLPID